MLWDGLLLPLVLFLADEVGDADAAGQRVQEGGTEEGAEVDDAVVAVAGRTVQPQADEPAHPSCLLLVSCSGEERDGLVGKQG